MVTGDDDALLSSDYAEVELTVMPLRRRRIVGQRAKTTGRPKLQSGPRPPSTNAQPPLRQEDPRLWAVRDALLQADPTGARTAVVLREAFDQAYDGQRTGRWDYTQLLKTEKTHLGTLVEIWLQREFKFSDGDELDYKIAAQDVDAKWSRDLYGWEIPPEMYSRGDKLAMVVWANEYSARWALGLIRISESVLVPEGKQRDRKRRLNEAGADSILWVHRGKPMIKNTLLHLPMHIVQEISDAPTGQKAVSILFARAQRQLITRAAVATAAQQVDSAKRVRDARTVLAPDGIVILGHYDPHPRIARDLGLPVPTLGRFVSARLVRCRPGDSESSALIAGERWRLARPDDPLEPAPQLPKQGQDS
ncbi:NaeI family type II restriction endonuclease [Kribbella solani]|uniref:NaeI family type II restriction endonuclease n=1 Tax=Kribbella solani TaxID=236067 RepID=UPI0029A573BA|nr:NaeI family type II restriction endonuclease [Kribbella solani]MDX2970985.1 NaeI family type II restriction endonuclease [Kribbella solani]